MTTAQLGQIPVEVLRDSTGLKAQVGQVAVEVLRKNTALKAQLGQVAAELIRVNTAQSAQLGQIATEVLRHSGDPRAVLGQIVVELLRGNTVNPCARTSARTPLIYVPGAAPGQIIVVDPTGNPTPVDPDPVITDTQEYLVVTNGFSITIADGVTSLILDPATALATGTIKMPATPSYYSDADNTTKLHVSIVSTKNIASLTLLPNTGQAISNPATSLAAGVSIKYVLRRSNLTWYPQ